MKQKRYYALPYAWSPRPIYYNKNLLRQAGVTYPDYNSFDLDKLQTIAKKLTRDTNGDGRPDQIGYEYNFWGDRGIDTLLRPFGGHFLSDDEQTIVINNQKGNGAIQFWADMALKQKIGQSGSSFVGGKVGLSYGMGSWDIGYAVQNIKNKFEWDLGHFPKGPVSRCVVAESSGYGITAASKHPKEAWTYLKEYLSTEGQIYMKESFGIDVSRKSARTLDFPGMPKGLNVKVIFEMLDDYAVDAPMNPATDYVWPVVSREFSNIMTSKKSVSQALDTIKKEGDIILRTRKVK
jgi:multiple sugar transport system substrate-binding protein